MQPLISSSDGGFLYKSSGWLISLLWAFSAQGVAQRTLGEMGGQPVAAPLRGSHDALAPSNLTSNFAKPPQAARPQIRFWVPGAAVTDDGLRGMIDGFARLGFGGLELDAFPVPKGIGKDFEWGTSAWNHLVQTAASQAGANGMSIDFTNGPKWPIAMPEIRSADDPGALYELTFGAETVQAGHTFQGVVPKRRKIRGEGTTKLVAVLAYRTTGEKTLDPASVIDLTGKVRVNAIDHARSTVEFTAPEGTEPWILFSFWEQSSAQKTGAFYVIDHFSAAGAKASNDYWEEIGLPALGNDIKYVRSIFNDSLEYAVSMEWTRGMREVFQQEHGYDIVPYLPFVGMATTYPANDVPGYKATGEALGAQVEHDYRETLTTLYIRNHLRPMEQMAEKHGLTVRYQVAYNKPMQIEDSAAAVGIPETEALGRASMDMPRYMSGAVHLTGKPLYSIETSAELLNGYGQSLQDILWWNKRAWSGGVNVQRFHGESYSGEFQGPGNVAGQLPGQKWPGYSAMLAFSNNWTRQASPEALHRVLTYMARVNYVLQKRATVDVAVFEDAPDIYDDSSRKRGDGNAVYPDGGVLSANGFSYDFVSPGLLDLPQASIANGRLDAGGPAYKALIIHNQSGMTSHVLDRLQQLAGAGLNIVFVGDVPTRNASLADQLRGHSDADIRNRVDSLLTMATVTRVAEYSAVPAALRRLGCHPDAEPAAPVDILTQHRSDRSAEFYYLHNYNEVSDADAAATGQARDHTKYPNLDRPANLVPKSARFSLAGTGKPYFLDAWTGNIKPIPQFMVDGGRVQVTVRLGGDEAILIALLTDQEARIAGLTPVKSWATATDQDSDTLTYGRRNELSVKIANSGVHTVRLNKGGTVSLQITDLQPSQPIQDWSLAIDSIEAPTTGSTLFSDAVWRKLGPFKLGATLKPWNQIDPSLARVSGIGTYEGTFHLEEGWGHGGSAFLDLGELNDSFTVRVNGKELSALDQENPIIDLGPYARSGTNTISVQVATTLYNSVAGSGKSYGLLGTGGTVIVRPYRLKSVSGRSERIGKQHLRSRRLTLLGDSHRS